MFAEEPRRHHKRSNQASREHAASLQCVERKNVAEILAVGVPGAPVEDHIQNFRSNDSGENDCNAKIPGILSFYALLGRVANADPKADKNTERDQHAIRRYSKMAELKESGEHESSLLDAGRTGKSSGLAMGPSGDLNPSPQRFKITR